MARYGKFYQAKKVALALQGLVRGRYPEDSLQVIGFYTYASPLSQRDLVRSAPKPVSLFDSRVFLRVPLDQPHEGVPEHFTNIQAGLRFARHVLHRQPARNKQIICITDGEPTAHLEGRELVLLYPPSDRTAKATLQEVNACVQAGIQLSTSTPKRMMPAFVGQWCVRSKKRRDASCCSTVRTATSTELVSVTSITTPTPPTAAAASRAPVSSRSPTATR